VVEVPVNGRSPVDGNWRAETPSFWSRARWLTARKPTHMLHPPKNSSEAAYRITRRVGGGEFAYLLGEEMDFV
jgi:hypothetical protein